jgi:hypothetical protein
VSSLPSPSLSLVALSIRAIISVLVVCRQSSWSKNCTLLLAPRRPSAHLACSSSSWTPTLTDALRPRATTSAIAVTRELSPIPSLSCSWCSVRKSYNFGAGLQAELAVQGLNPPPGGNVRHQAASPGLMVVRSPDFHPLPLPPNLGEKGWSFSL